MKHHQLLGFGGALLATTALSTAASAGSFITKLAVLGTGGNISLTAAKLSSQAFTGASDAAHTIGPQSITANF